MDLGKLCNIFDGQTARHHEQSTYSHITGGLAFYKGKPTSVGSYLPEGAKRVESRSDDGRWISIEHDHPE